MVCKCKVYGGSFLGKVREFIVGRRGGERDGFTTRKGNRDSFIVSSRPGYCPVSGKRRSIAVGDMARVFPEQNGNGMPRMRKIRKRIRRRDIVLS